jgi:hypothetical protein
LFAFDNRKKVTRFFCLAVGKMFECSFESAAHPRLSQPYFRPVLFQIIPLSNLMRQRTFDLCPRHDA